MAQAAVLAMAVLAFFALGVLRAFNLSFVLDHFPDGVGPALVSIELTTLSFAIGFALAIPLGLVRAYGPGPWPDRAGRPWPLAVQATALFGLVELATVGFFGLSFLGLYSIDAVEEGLARRGDPLGALLVLTVLWGLVSAVTVLLLRRSRGARAISPRRPGSAPVPAGGRPIVPPAARRSIPSADAAQVAAVLRWPFYGFATGYVTAVRGTPFLVQMFLVFYAFIFASPKFVFLGVTLPFWAGLIALAINTTAYQAEALRGGFQSVDRSQVEAARALGLGKVQIFLRVTLPQSLRLVTLPLSNEWISTFKTSTILSYISVVELYFWARSDIASQLARPIEAFVLLALFYLLVNVTLSRTVSYVEKRYRIPGLGSMVPEIPGRRGLLERRA
ncbi:MAG TPA: amino acid ABC transporter permease [Thermoplasmata archaeon]